MRQQSSDSLACTRAATQVDELVGEFVRGSGDCLRVVGRRPCLPFPVRLNCIAPLARTSLYFRFSHHGYTLADSGI